MATIIDWLMTNWYLIIIPVVSIWILWEWFLKPTSEKKLKPLSRSEIERKNFVERNKFNTTILFKWVFRGKKLLGKLQTMKIMLLMSNGGKSEMEEVKAKDVVNVNNDGGFVEMVIQPVLSSRLKILNPFAKEICMMVDRRKIDFSFPDNEIILDEKAIFDQYFGIYYDLGMKEELAGHIVNDNIFKTDMENLASIYFAKSQEQSTFAPEFAHEMAMKEKELQVELAKKRGKQSSI